MLHLLARPALPEPPPTRQAAQGVQSLRNVLADPNADAQLSVAQVSWLERHSDEAFDFLMQLSSAAASQTWIDHQLQELAARSALVVSGQQYLENWESLRRSLDEDSFLALTARLLRVAESRDQIIAGTSDAQVVSIALEAGVREPGEEHVGDVRTWAKSIVLGATESEWQAAFARPEGGPLLSVALELAETPEAPVNPPGLDNALHSHFQVLAAGQPAWRADGATLTKLTSLLGASARRARASELCAWLEGRDGAVGPELFQTYGDFLASERQFRIHPKLPNFVERLVARGEWDGVQWVVETAEAHKDTLQPTNRTDELEHLRNKVSEKLAEFGDEPPDALSRLSVLLGNKD